jgi:hypothetical protein
MTSEQVLKDFDKRMIRAHPLTYARFVLRDTASGFAVSRLHDVPGYPAGFWLFRDYNWRLNTFPGWKAHYSHYYSPGSPASEAAGFLADYRRALHTPGPLMAALLLVAVAAVVGVGRSRFSGVRVAVGLLAGSCAVALLTAAAFSGFSWRYQLPQIPLLPMAGALGLAALVRGAARGQEPPAAPPPLLDRRAVVVATRRMRGGGADIDLGRLRLALAASAGVVSGVVVAALAYLSGWAAAGTAAILGVLVAVVAATMLIFSHWRGSTRHGPGEDPTAPVEVSESV